ncbi:MAG TPA: hypothetical protein PKE47_10270, partial [Verrucomicrobiota bacterium]|nr:hypothetical protein [Verrucomicrobiota bacterium]
MPEAGHGRLEALLHLRLAGGGDAGERVTTVTPFTASASTAPPAAEPLIVLPPGSLLLLPEVAWQFDEATQALDAGGSLQGAVLRHGRGRVAVFA